MSNPELFGEAHWYPFPFARGQRIYTVNTSLYQYMWINGHFDYNSRSGFSTALKSFSDWTEMKIWYSEWTDGVRNEKFPDWAWKDSSTVHPIQDSFVDFYRFFELLFCWNFSKAIHTSILFAYNWGWYTKWDRQD